MISGGLGLGCELWCQNVLPVAAFPEIQTCMGVEGSHTLPRTTRHTLAVIVTHVAAHTPEMSLKGQPRWVGGGGLAHRYSRGCRCPG